MAEVELKVGGQKRSRRALWILLVGAGTIGFAPIFVRSSEVGPSATGAWRVLLAAPFLWGGMMAQSRRRKDTRRRLTRRDCLILVIPGLVFAADLGFWHWSLKLTTVANATFFANCSPIFVAVVGWIWLKERLGWTFVQGLLLGIGGAAIMILLKPQGVGGEQGLLGDVLALVTAIFYGGYQLSVKRLRARYSTLTIMAFSAVVSGVLIGGVAWVAGETLFPVTLSGCLVLLGLALMVHVGGQGLITYALGHLPVSFASVSLLFQPVVAATLGWVLLGEAVGGWQGLGGVLVLIGIYLARRGSGEQSGSR